MKTFVILASIGVVGANMLFAKPEAEPVSYMFEKPASVMLVEWDSNGG